MEERSTVEKMALFNRWYEVPIQQLARLPNGDGGFVAMIIGLLLYERYVGVMHHVGKSDRVTIDMIAEQLPSDLLAELGCSIDKRTAKQFWAVYRNGLLHRGFPKLHEELPAWRFTHKLGQPIERKTYGCTEVIEAEPWRFANFVLSLWRKHPEHLDEAIDYPIPYVGI